jgi:hypothetical protein
MIKKAEVTNLHGKHVELGGVVPDARPFLTVVTLGDLITPGPGTGLALKQPIGHCP